MFDFEKLKVYQKATELNILLLKHMLKETYVDPILRDQLKRATLSVVLNLAEGTGRTGRADKRRFYTIARSSTFEVVAILEVFASCDYLDDDEFEFYYSGYEEVSKMLLSLYRNTR
jgi:four helix bundle protein